MEVVMYLTYPKVDPDTAAFIQHDSCPSCNDGNFTHPVRDEEEYVDDEKCMTTTVNAKNTGPRFHPYKDWMCDNCGAEWRVYLGPIAIEISQEATRGA